MSAVLDVVPLRPFCTNDFSRGLRIRSRQDAQSYDHIQPNAPWLCRYILLDVDHEGAAFRWEETGLPAPTFVIVNPDSSHAHYAYELEIPVSTANRKAHAKLQWIKNAFIVMAGADPAYKGILCRNPASERHITIHNHRVYPA